MGQFKTWRFRALIAMLERAVEKNKSFFIENAKNPVKTLNVSKTNKEMIFRI